LQALNDHIIRVQYKGGELYCVDLKWWSGPDFEPLFYLLNSATQNGAPSHAYRLAPAQNVKAHYGDGLLWWTACREIAEGDEILWAYEW
jgi:hypothetical protein